ncbi:Nephrin [Orchesella cincta]|uniref:Nephrin n=1 Tax=Orchesella cincta TaxID=48709 RepID=A0A1D2N1X6_ORCCI|nr:Nephrin [Orchesella cincta]
MGDELVSSKEPVLRQNGVLAKKLKLVQLRREHHGANLTCFTFNSNLTEPLSESLRLSLYLSPLSARITPRDRLVANQRHQIECIVTGSRPKVSISWWMGSSQLTDVDFLKDDELPTHRGLETEEGENVTRSTVGLVPTIDDDGQKITCKAENPWVPRSIVEDSRILHVVYPPAAVLKLGSALQEDEIKEGDDVYFECHLKSNPPHHKLDWMLNLVTRRSAGNYTCVASNSVGTTVSNVFPLRVKYAPVCKREKPVIVGVSKGEHVTIKCELDSDPEEVSFKWHLASSGQMVEVPPSRYSNKGATSILHYSPISNLDYGSLFCRGTNSVGAQMTAQSCVFQVVAAGKQKFFGATYMYPCMKRVNLEKLVCERAACFHLLGREGSRDKLRILSPTQKPSPVTNCTVFNETAESVELSCDEGHDGGLPQHFVLEVLEIDTSEVRYNASSNTASFHLGNLTPSGTGFRALIYSVNAKGRSEPYRIDELVAKQTEKMAAAVTPQEYSWFSFALSVAIGGTAVFLCVGTVMIFRVLQLRSKARKRASTKKLHEESHKNSTGNLQSHDGQMDAKDGISSDDKDPDIIPSNIGGTDHSTISPAIVMSSSSTTNGERVTRYTTATLPAGSANYCLQPNVSYPVEHHPQVQYPQTPNAQHYALAGEHVHHHQQQQIHHQYYGDPGDMMSGARVPAGYATSTLPTNYQQYRMQQGATPMNELDNFSTLGTLRHPSDPYYDPKQVKQKLLSVNVPESCV